MKDALLSTLMHAVELAACFGVAVGVLYLFHADTETKTLLLTIVLAALTKFARSSAGIPVPDYVNK